MAGHVSHEDAIKGVYKGLGLLAVVTVVEVIISLSGKGYIPGTEGLASISWMIYPVGLLLIGLSLYKAYFIIYEFMHMGYEVRGLAMSVLLPVLLLVWALVAFFNEGKAWKTNRDVVQERNELSVGEPLQLESNTLDLTKE